jgi:hypothetical protein
MATSMLDAVSASGAVNDDILHAVEAITKTYHGRDRRANAVRAVRNGDFDALNPDLFTDEWPRPTVANLVDIYARDMASAMAPLPSFNCASSITLKPGAQKFADKRTKIVNNYIRHSNLAAQMQGFADSFNCYGMGVFRIQPDFDDMMPRITVEDSSSTYVVWNQRLEVVIAVQQYQIDWYTLESNFPDAINKVKVNRWGIMGGQVKVIRYEDANVCLAYLPDHGNCVLINYANPIGRPMIVAIPRPGGSGNWQAGDIHGAYDDLIWPQLARHQLQMYAMEAADKAVRAPLVVPLDAIDLAIGPDAVWRTNQGINSVGRVPLDVPQASFAAMQWLERDMQMGSGTPESRTGQTDASVITGRGIQELNAGYSATIAAAQTMFVLGLQQLVELCSLMDEKLFDTRKSIRGSEHGVPYEVTYIPSKDIAGDYSVEIEYGFYAGLDPNRALIYILQALGAKIISTTTARRALDMGLNPEDEEQLIQMEDLRTSLLGAIAAHGTGRAADRNASGGDPTTPVMSYRSSVIKGLQDGDQLEDLGDGRLRSSRPGACRALGLLDLGSYPLRVQVRRAAGQELRLPVGGGLQQGGKPASAGPCSQVMSASGSPNLSGGVSQMLAAR